LTAEVVRWDACSAGDDSLPGTATPSEECERHGLMTTGPDGADLIQIEVYDQIHLAPRVCQFLMPIRKRIEEGGVPEGGRIRL